MSVVSIFCFVGLAAVLASCIPKAADPVSPGRIFLGIWLTVIGLADLKLSYYQHTWSTYAWLVLVIGVSSMVLGIFASQALTVGSPRLSIDEIRQRFRTMRLNDRLLFRMTLTLFAVYMLGYITEVLIFGRLPLFTARPDVARIEFGVFGIHLLVTTLPTLCYLALQYLLIVRGKRREKIIMGIVFGVTFLSFFAILQRFLYVHWALMAFVLVYYTGRRFRFRHVLLLGGVFLGLMFYIQSFRVAVYVQNYIYMLSRMKFPVEYALLTEPYMYVVMNVENFARGVERLDFFTLGLFTTDVVMALTGLKHWLATYFSVVDRPFLVSGYNTFPFLWPYYYDFGVPGVVIFPLILGFLAGNVYHALRSRPGLFNLACYAIVFFLLVISFFTNPLSMLWTVSNFVLLLALQAYLAKMSGDPA